MSKQEIFKPVFENAVRDRDSKKRTMTVVVSDETVNRYGHVVKVDGWDYKNYMSNPVVLVNHDSMKFPVAKANRVWKSKKGGKKSLMATMEFLPEGVSPEADLAYILYDNGFMTSVSPGYMVNFDKAEYGKTEKDPKVTFNGQELLEISLATVPANPGAIKQNKMIQECLDLGIIDDVLIERYEETLTKAINDEIEEIEDEIVIKNEVEENTEQTIKEDTELDYTDKDVQEADLEDTEDPYSDAFQALDEIIQEQKIVSDIDSLSSKVIESFQASDESKEDSDDEFDTWLEEQLS